MSDSTSKIITNKKLLLKGTHGTTISSAQNILQRQSFLKTAAENGYTGSGVYLWRYNRLVRK